MVSDTKDNAAMNTGVWISLQVIALIHVLGHMLALFLSFDRVYV
jgi:ABC-type arginine/histidine transport system permease subunit